MDIGGWIVVLSVGLALGAAFFLRVRAPAGLVAASLAVAGSGIGWGGMLIQPDPSVGEFIAGVGLLAVLVPAHVRIVLGPFGPRS